MRVVPVEEPQKYGVVVGVTEQPAPASGVVVGVVTEQPGASSGGAARGSLESLGRWNEKRGGDRAMPIKLKLEDHSLDLSAEKHTETMVRVAFGKLVDELVQTKGASSGILAISNWKEMRGPHEVTVSVSEVSWSASPDDTSYQRHGSVDEVGRLKAQLAAAEAKKRGEKPLGFADFEGIVSDMGDKDQIAVYRVTLPSRGLDPDKWVGRAPLAPEDLYTGPRSDGLLSTEEISGEYSAPCICGGDPSFHFPVICNSMTVVPLGADAIETWRTGCLFFPPLMIAPCAVGDVRTRRPGTNTFHGMTFSADGTANGCYKKRQTSQKRAFQKVETRDLAGKWCGGKCLPFVHVWPFSLIFYTTKKALNEDQYAESGIRCCLALPLPCPVETTTRTRIYANGHATNGFASDYNPDPNSDQFPSHQWHRNPGSAGGSDGGFLFFAKKVG